MASQTWNDADQYWEIASEPRLRLLHTASTSLRSQLASKREALEVERQAVKRVLCKLDTSLNELQPVNLLPSDVLTHIFLLVKESFAESLKPFTSSIIKPKIFPPRWFSLVHVCKRWRSEALSLPSLWCHLTTSMGPKALKEFIRLSQDASLSLVLENKRYKNTTERLDLIFVPGVLDRTQQLVVAYGRLGPKPQLYIPYLAHPMPRLESFIYRHAARDAEPPNNLFNGIAPRLKSLVLELLPGLPQPSYLFRNLRVFSLITGTSTGAFAHAPSSRLFELLETMPLLECLELRNTLPAEPFTPYYALPLPRPHLKTLILEGPILACICVVRAFHLPRDCATDIDCDASATSVEAFDGLVDALCNAGLGGIAPRTLLIRSHSRGNFHLTAYADAVEPEFLRARSGYEPREPPAPIFGVYIRGLAVVDNSSIPSLITTVCKQIIPLERLEALSISIDMAEFQMTGGPTASSELTELWHSLLGPCSHLHDVACAGAPAYVLLRELAATREASRFLPTLKLLIFDEDNLSR
ncbi:unnamed protein product [Peniophora sp. CBMAI 1063]|nr:unnamed protein product [Peniophora sp. CBMAI 1063]